MPHNSRTPDPQAWKTFLENLHPDRVLLFEVRAKRVPLFPEEPILKPMELQRNDFRIHFPVGQQQLLSEERLSLQIRARGVRTPLIRIMLHTGIMFSTKTPYDPGFESLFFQYVHTPILWPYLRRWVQDITRDMGLGDGILLPLIVVGGKE